MIEIINKNDCCGCLACVQKCPTQCISCQTDDEGFLYPSVDKTACIHCNICLSVCPVINKMEERKPIKIIAAYNKDEDVRIKSSSGGMFHIIAEAIINAGGVVFGARFNKNWKVEHGYSETLDDLTSFLGSKYVQSDIGNTYIQASDFLKNGRLVLFSGTPCQIAGLKTFLGKDYKNLLTLDLICHGVPSPGIWSNYIDSLLKKQKEKNSTSILSNIYFRDKRLGWRLFSFSTNWIYGDGTNEKEETISETRNKDLFMQGFLSDLYLRPICYSCPFRNLTSGSDFTIGDLWGVGNLSLPIKDDNRGISNVLFNTTKALNYYNLVCDKTNNCHLTFSQSIQSNPGIINKKSIDLKRLEKRNKFYKMQWENIPFKHIIKKLTRRTFRSRIKYKVKRVVKKIWKN